MPSFIIDTQLPPALARWLKAKGFDAIHTTDFPDGHLMTDAEIQAISIREDRIVVTKDNDFYENFLLRGMPPRVLLLQFGNCSNHNLLSQFDKFFNQVQECFEQGAGLVLFTWNKIAEY